MPRHPPASRLVRPFRPAVTAILLACALNVPAAHAATPAFAPPPSLAEQVAARLLAVVQIKVRRAVPAALPPNPAFPAIEPAPLPGGTGSGFVFDARGHLLTNAHVVRNAREIAVIGHDGREYAATLVGSDQTTDVAVLSTEPVLAAPPPPIGDPAALRPGDALFAIGAPFGLAHTVTSGIVSATGRFVPSNPHVAFIQTDAAINPGNSGGPLFDAAGRIVGINSLAFSRSGGYTSIAFAIPIDEALRVAALLLRDRQVKRGWLGADIFPAENSARLLGQRRGALLTRVHPGTPASRAGLKSGDLVVGIGGAALADVGALHRALAVSSPGERLELDVWRDQSRRHVTVALGEEETRPRPRHNANAQDPARELGLILQEPAPLPGARDKAGPLRILASYGTAEGNGLEPGDEIESLDGQPVPTLADFNRAVQRLPAGEAALLRLRRQGEYLALPLGPRRTAPSAVSIPGR